MMGLFVAHPGPEFSFVLTQAKLLDLTLTRQR